MKPIYGICIYSTLAVRGKNAHSSEMTSQLLYGELYKVIEFTEDNEWVKIQMHFDKYEGYITKGQHNEVAKDYADRYIKAEHPVVTRPIFPIFDKQKTIHLSIGSTLPFHYEKCDNTQINYAKLHSVLPSENEGDLLETASKYLGVPYLWGGRSIAGIDCSGFAQTVYNAHGIKLPRDAYQQAEIGSKVTFEEATAGDLAYFHNDKGRITHVGIVSNNGKIIHASHYVREDLFTVEGIYSNKEGKITHQLSHIMRVIS
ncbi:C40 family peptidase [Flammeovirga yaeyamensis]|uniref:C40 family peptidase n=1 Tax=Flammeovirga yaeyamensis TaxID=367791 RepID=A0AAX1N2F7_9BACT|nr:C40 family peptidase [Flammeovirga yaeyamensis]MBB3696386.1 cell wall-associated NlpC family hydrolase [Flammeovirga yaeyamensis]NMF35065.1 C40 family peptidase [Flammeovirga yaeyamensis]QWG00113.1 C40 family peptidase [Flammeovirga yaeyamensis]